MQVSYNYLVCAKLYNKLHRSNPDRTPKPSSITIHILVCITVKTCMYGLCKKNFAVNVNVTVLVTYQPEFSCEFLYRLII